MQRVALCGGKGCTLSLKELLVAPSPRVLLPGGRLDLRLDARLWSLPLRENPVSGLAVLLRPNDAMAWPRVGTWAGIIGRRSEGDAIFLRLRGLRRLRTLDAPQPAVVTPVEVDDAAVAHRAGDPSVTDLTMLVRRYHAHLVEHGERADITVDLPQDSERAAYAVASLLRVSALEQQFVLEAGSQDERMRRVTAVLKREIRLLQTSMGPKGA